MRVAILTRSLIVLAVLALAWPAPAAAQRRVALSLALSPITISFPSADPDTTPVVTAGAITITYGIRDKNKDDVWQLTVQAAGDLQSGSATIPISNISWSASPAPPFQNGVLSSTLAQLLASGPTDVSPAATATVVFRLANSWSYNVGTYTQSIVFTLTSQ
jgi:hypothetical protein